MVINKKLTNASLCSCRFMTLSLLGWIYVLTKLPRLARVDIGRNSLVTPSSSNSYPNMLLWCVTADGFSMPAPAETRLSTHLTVAQASIRNPFPYYISYE
ncbi:unnamed protein product [Fusarium graminearum]|nr:unnamed protein product [Fusarium graminearum]CAG1963737.1 unnamed protein product [Fusarium graminearum]VTO81995.1 unnamed protein product [Fusarium graminearum]